MPLSKIKTGSITTSVTLTSPTITTPVISSLSSASATALTLQSAGTTAITVDTSQNVGIGTTSPSTYGKLGVRNRLELHVFCGKYQKTDNPNHHPKRRSSDY
jgi:phosphate-selective porin